VRVVHPDAEAELAFGAQWYVTPEDQLIYELQQMLSEQQVALQFH
jgi:DNA polymerase-3 subunit alpha